MRWIITELNCTCIACPSQWEGRLDDGRYIYVRYRWGHCRIGIGNSLDEAIDDNMMEFAYGTRLSGEMSYKELKELTSNTFDWP